MLSVMRQYELLDIIQKAQKVSREEKGGLYKEENQCGDKAFRILNELLSNGDYILGDFRLFGGAKNPMLIGDAEDGKPLLDYKVFINKNTWLVAYYIYSFKRTGGVHIPLFHASNHTVVQVYPKNEPENYDDSIYLDNFVWDTWNWPQHTQPPSPELEYGPFNDFKRKYDNVQGASIFKRQDSLLYCDYYCFLCDFSRYLFTKNR